jgi:hypothetical protein
VNTRKILVPLLADLVFFGLACVVAAVLVEGAARLIQWNARPMIPFVIDRLGATRLEANLEMPIRLPQYARTDLVTDDLGARVASVAARDTERTGGVLFVGDSQILGWGLPFEQTAAALLAGIIGVPLAKVAIIAAPAEDPEKEIGWAQDYARLRPQRQRVEVVTLNLGNDLEEIYLTRAGTRFQSSGGLSAWLSHHSLAYIDLALLRGALWGEQGEQHPEVNSAMLRLDGEERSLLATGVATSLERLFDELPPADRRIVMVTPQDSQVRIQEFDKYRRFYPDEADFRLHKAAQEIAVKRLEEIQRTVSAHLRAANLTVVLLEPALREIWGKADIIDTHSHHLMAAGQEIAARAVAAAMEAAQ